MYSTDQNTNLGPVGVNSDYRCMLAGYTHAHYFTNPAIRLA